MTLLRGASFDEFSISSGREDTRFETTDPRAARDASARFLAPHHLTVGDGRDRFRAVGDRVDLGPVSLAYVTYGAEVTIDRAVSPDYVSVILPLTGSALVRQGGQEVVARAASTYAAVTTGATLHMRWTSDCRALVLRAGESALQASARRLAPYGRHDDLTFNSGRVAGSEAAALAGLTELLVHVCRAHAPAGAIPEIVRRQLGEQAISALLLSIPNSSTSQIVAPPAGHRASVRTVIDLLSTETEAIFTVGDLAREAGVGLRALELAFQRDLGMTPRAFVQKWRLEKARDELISADPEWRTTTVTAVAARWGFGHVGRFASMYQRQFGVLPSETLGSRH